MYKDTSSELELEGIEPYQLGNCHPLVVAAIPSPFRRFHILFVAPSLVITNLHALGASGGRDLYPDSAACPFIAPLSRRGVHASSDSRQSKSRICTSGVRACSRAQPKP